MKKTRALEIMASPIMADVNYNGIAVYLEDVDVHNRTATIHLIENPDIKEQVPLDVLREEEN